MSCRDNKNVHTFGEHLEKTWSFFCSTGGSCDEEKQAARRDCFSLFFVELLGFTKERHMETFKKCTSQKQFLRWFLFISNLNIKKNFVYLDSMFKKRQNNNVIDRLRNLQHDILK